jgi:hypothetical protein
MRKSRNFMIFIALMIAVLASNSYARDADNMGRTLGLEFAPGMMGGLSLMQAGVTLPTIGKSFQIGLKARYMSAFTWCTFIDPRTGEQVSFHPVAAAGVISFGGSGPILRENGCVTGLRPYGMMDILAGYSFTPYDDMIYHTGNLIGPNLTFGLFTSGRLSIFLDAGGGFKTLHTDNKDNPYAISSSWIGSGFGLKMGIRFYP